MIKAFLKRLFPRRIRMWRYAVADHLDLHDLWRPAPLREFKDYDDSLELVLRGRIGADRSARRREQA